MAMVLGVAGLATSATAVDFDGVYPPSRRSDHVDSYHGREVPDPYRWLEAADSDEARAWIDAQNRITMRFLESCPQRAPLQKRLTELWDFERYDPPQKAGTRYFYTHNNGLQNQSVLYVTDSLDGERRVLLDPNTLSEQGTVALSGWETSDDGKFLAYGLAEAGSDWVSWRVRSADTGEDLADHLRWIKFSGVSWTPDNAGFYYSRYDEPRPGEELTGVNYFQQLFFHRLGDPQDQDRLVYHRPDEKEWGFQPEVTEDGKYLVITVWRSTETQNQVLYQPLGDPAAAVVELRMGFDAEYRFLGNQGTTFWFLTDRDAPRRRIVAVDVARPQPENWRVLVEETADTIENAHVVGDRLIVSYLKDAATRVRIHDLQGGFERELPLPGLGTATGFGGKRKDRETFYGFTSFTTPTAVYRLDFETGESRLFRQPQVEFDPADYETRQVFYQSKDGTRVPMFLTMKRGLKANGDLPTLLYGYGGFDIALTPAFSVTNLVWMEAGGVYAVPNLRGGGEYGRAWHEAGMKQKKQNVFDDFIAAAEWLIDNGITRRERLAILGRSNGGLLVGAAMTQRPDLFGAALPGVGVMDMLRFHRFTIGWAWVPEFGSSDDSQEFAHLLAYSPLHNLRPGTSYPATLVTTSDHDDRVVPAHSFKFAAALQHAHAGPSPVLIRIETRAGHGAGKPTAKRIEEAADVLAFTMASLGLEPDFAASR